MFFFFEENEDFNSTTYMMNVFIYKSHAAMKYTFCITKQKQFSHAGSTQRCAWPQLGAINAALECINVDYKTRDNMVGAASKKLIVSNSGRVSKWRFGGIQTFKVKK